MQGSVLSRDDLCSYLFSVSRASGMCILIPGFSSGSTIFWSFLVPAIHTLSVNIADWDNSRRHCRWTLVYRYRRRFFFGNLRWSAKTATQMERIKHGWPNCCRCRRGSHRCLVCPLSQCHTGYSFQILDRTFTKPRELLVCTLLGKITQYQICGSAAIGTLKLELQWKVSSRDCYKVNSIAFSGEFIIIGGFQKDGIGVIEVWSSS